MQIRTTVRYHCTPIKISKTSKSARACVPEHTEQLIPPPRAGGRTEIVQLLWETADQLLKSLYIHIPHVQAVYC